MKKIKRSYNGMTLVEVLVALAVFTIISALLASACAGICTIMRKTNRLNKKKLQTRSLKMAFQLLWQTVLMRKLL